MTADIDQALRGSLRVVALRDADAASLARSASGGAFSVLARPVLEAGGVVFGVEALPGGVVRHVGIESTAELPRLQGSKYVQSDVADTFCACAEALALGREVLWSGTPCQVYALRRYLERAGLSDAAACRLQTVDLICHGVPDPALFRLYVSWLEKKLDAVPGSLRYEFRSKRRGWGLNYCYSWISSRTGAKSERLGPAVDDPYYAAFLAGFLFRSACYSCPFACAERVGDFTIGDFWGIQKEHPDFDCRQGVSVLLMNTDRAVEFFEGRCMGSCVIEESSLEAAARHNENLVRPSRRDEASEVLVAAVAEALDRGDADLIFGQLLRVPRDAAYLKRRIVWRLPEPLVDALKTLLGRC